MTRWLRMATAAVGLPPSEFDRADYRTIWDLANLAVARLLVPQCRDWMELPSTSRRSITEY